VFPNQDSAEIVSVSARNTGMNKFEMPQKAPDIPRNIAAVLYGI
jgi:hypothetical protein